MAGEDENPQLPLEFYQAPDGYLCTFSTNFGALARKNLSFPLPARIVHTDFRDAIFDKAAELQRQFPDGIWNVVPPTHWNDLFHYFDPYDVYLMGPEFLIQVLRYVAECNEMANVRILKAIEDAAKEWIERHQFLQVSVDQCCYNR